MRLGIKKIEYISTRNLSDYSHLGTCSSFNIDSFILNNASFSVLPFVAEDADFEEQWIDDLSGRYSKISFSAPIRGNLAAKRQLLQSLSGKKYIWRVTFISGESRIIGSPEFLPSFRYTEKISGLTTSEFVIYINCNSLHGSFIVSP